MATGPFVCGNRENICSRQKCIEMLDLCCAFMAALLGVDVRGRGGVVLLWQDTMDGCRKRACDKAGDVCLQDDQGTEIEGHLSVLCLQRSIHTNFIFY